MNYSNEITVNINRYDFEIHTDRFTIKPVTIKEAEMYYKEFDEEITKYQYADSFESIEAARELIKNFIMLREAGINVMLSIFDRNNIFIGSIEIYGLNEKLPELGIWICKNFWRKGYAYEVIKEVINYLNKFNNFEGFIYEADRRNRESLKLINKFNPIYKGFSEVLSDSGKKLELNKYIIK